MDLFFQTLGIVCFIAVFAYLLIYICGCMGWTEKPKSDKEHGDMLDKDGRGN